MRRLAARLILLAVCVGPLLQAGNAFEIASPESLGLDARLLKAGVDKIEQGAYADIDSLLVLRDGKLVLEKYFEPEYHGRDYRQPVRSVTKSFASALIGIAIMQQKIDGVETSLQAFFPEYAALDNPDPRKAEITLHDVLSMSAGYQWDELVRHYGDPRNDANRMLRSDDWIKFVLDLPMRDDPGVRLEYNSGCSLLLSSILRKTTGQSAEDFAAVNLFGPMGIDNWSWPLATGDLTGTHWGLSLTRRGMARFGQLYLDLGRWQDQQLIPAGWVEASTGEQITGDAGTPYANYAYGYQWWRFRDFDPTVRDLQVNDVFFAYGDGGQLIMVVPHLKLVIVSTANLVGDDARLQFDLIREHVFAAVAE